MHTDGDRDVEEVNGEAVMDLLVQEKNPLLKAAETVAKIPMYVKFEDPKGRPAIECGIKISF